MSTFNYTDYTNVVNKAQNGGSTSVKVGFFKLGGEGDQALVRINVANVDELHFATIHKPVYGKKYEGLSNPYAGISCINPLGSYGDDCPLCRAAAQEGAVVGKAAKQVYVPMLVSYKDKATQQYSAPVPVIWERPAGFAKELAAKIQTFGSLKDSMFVITRTGMGKDTRYILDYAVPQIFKPEMIPADFSAFNNFNVNRHSYWEKTVEEIETFLSTGSFPAIKKDEAVAPKAEASVAPTAPTAPVDPTPYVAPTPAVAPAPYAAPVAPAAAPQAATPSTPVNAPKSSGTIGGWSF